MADTEVPVAQPGPSDQTAPITADQNAINLAILAGIQKLNENMAQLYGPEDNFVEESEPEIDENPLNVDVDADINNIANVSDSADAERQECSADNAILNYGTQLDINTVAQGPKINDDVADVANKLQLQRISSDQCKAKIKLHATPENVQVRVPKCEPTIWDQLPPHSRTNDAKFQSTQAMLLASLNCQLKVADSLLSTKASKEILTTCLDGITLGLTANFEINQRRREAIRPQFRTEFAKALCSSNNPADEFLFGGDTSKKVKEVAEINKNRVCQSRGSARGRGYRFSPYPTTAYRPGMRGRGRGFRGRGTQWGSSSFSGYQQRQPFRNVPQSGKKFSQKSTQWYVSPCNKLKQLITNQQPFVAGNTKNYVSEWHKVTSDPSILDYIAHCHIEFIDDPSKYSTCGQTNFNSQQDQLIEIEVKKLARLGAVGVSESEIGECISPIFVTPKTDGSFRLIFNFKHCNQAVLFRHFKMDTLYTVLNLVTPGVYMASLDLKHAYYTIPIAQEHRKFLKFVWKGQLYEFRTLPMGLTSSPRIFTKLVKPVLATLRQQGHVISGYIDDFFLQGDDMSECIENLNQTIELFLKLGFHIHPEKCVLIPIQEITFLGFVIDSVSMTVTLSPQKKEKLKSLCLQALSGQVFTIRFIAHIIGKIVSSLPGVQFGKLHYRNLERVKIKTLAHHHGNYEGIMSLSEPAREDLYWWANNVMAAHHNIRSPPITYTFQTDASDTGWGIHCTTHTSLQSQGLWSQEQASLHIYVRELYVVYICLTIFCKAMVKAHVRFELDNFTAVTYINHMGGSKSIPCDTVAKKIWQWCVSRDLWLTALHIPGSTNVIADSLSRKYPSDHEWKLNPLIFQKMCQLFPPFSIDLFASKLNFQLPRYASWKPDPQATIIDAFSISWGKEYFYSFPPFSLIHKCLDKIQTDQAKGVLVVPMWPTQTWYTKILQMLAHQPRLLLWKPDMKLLLHPQNKVHSMEGTLKLMACPISGNVTESRAFQSTLSKYSSTHGDLLHRNNMVSISRNGSYSVIKERLIHILPI